MFLILQLATWDRLRIFLAVIQAGVVTTLVIFLRAEEVTMGTGALKEIISAVKQSGPTVFMSSWTLTLQALGYPSAGAWTAMLVWSTAGARNACILNSRTPPRSAEGALANDSETPSGTASQWRCSSRRRSAPHRARRGPGL